MKVHSPWVDVILLGTLASGCQRAPTPAASASPSAVAEGRSQPAAEGAIEPAPEATPLPSVIAPVFKPFKGDLDGMVKRRVIRVLTVQNPILYFVDRGREVGITYETIKALREGPQREARQQGRDRLRHRHPRRRDQLIPRLLAGQGDIAAAALTVTPERKTQVDFSDPFASGVREVLVTGPERPSRGEPRRALGQGGLRPALEQLRRAPQDAERALQEGGQAPVTIMPAPEVLEDGDILEMVNAGLVPATVVDSFMADLYTQVFPNLRSTPTSRARPVDIAWAFRKGSPKLAASRQRVREDAQAGLARGNVLINKYLKTTKWVKNARSDEDRKRLLVDGRPVQEVRQAVRPRLRC